MEGLFEVYGGWWWLLLLPAVVLYLFVVVAVDAVVAWFAGTTGSKVVLFTLGLPIMVCIFLVYVFWWPWRQWKEQRFVECFHIPSTGDHEWTQRIVLRRLQHLAYRYDQACKEQERLQSSASGILKYPDVDNLVKDTKRAFWDAYGLACDCRILTRTDKVSYRDFLYLPTRYSEPAFRRVQLIKS